MCFFFKKSYSEIKDDFNFFVGHGFWTLYNLFVCLETSVKYQCSYQKQDQQPVIIQWAYSYNVEGQLNYTILYEGFEHVQIIVSMRVSGVNPLHIPRDYCSIHKSLVVWTLFSLCSLRFTGVLAAKSLALLNFWPPKPPR